MSADQTYKTKYTIDIEAGKFTAKDIVDKDKEGLTDTLILASINKIEEEEGTHVSIKIVDYNGDDPSKPVPDRELFLVFATLADRLSQSDDIDPAFQSIASAANASAAKVCIKARMNGSNPIEELLGKLRSDAHEETLEHLAIIVTGKEGESN